MHLRVSAWFLLYRICYIYSIQSMEDFEILLFLMFKYKYHLHTKLI